MGEGLWRNKVDQGEEGEPTRQCSWTGWEESDSLKGHTVSNGGAPYTSGWGESLIKYMYHPQFLFLRGILTWIATDFSLR